MWSAQCVQSRCVQSRSVKNAVLYVMRYKQTQKCSCGEAQLHVACSDFLVGEDLLGRWWLTVKIPAQLELFSLSFILAFFLMYLQLLHCAQQGFRLHLLYFFMEVTAQR